MACQVDRFPADVPTAYEYKLVQNLLMVLAPELLAEDACSQPFGQLWFSRNALVQLQSSIAWAATLSHHQQARPTTQGHHRRKR